MWSTAEKEIASLFARLETRPDDTDSALKLCNLLLAEGREVPLFLREISLRHHPEAAPDRNDLAFQLATVLMEQGREVPPDLELQALRENISNSADNIALYDRYLTVVAGTLLAKSGNSQTAEETAEGRRIVERAKGNLAQTDGDEGGVNLPSYGVRWGEYAERVGRQIADIESPASALRFAQSGIGFEHRFPFAQVLTHFPMYERELRTEFPHYADRLDEFDDPCGSVPQTQAIVNGRQVSNIVPYLARVVMSCLTVLPDIKTVLELGGGYGAPARLWLNNRISPIENYIIVDIPQSLFFAEVFLRDQIGSDAVYYVENAEPLSEQVRSKYRVILCPVSRLSALDPLPVDLVVNTGSLQEMSEEWVDYYMDWLDRLSARFFYSLNYAAQPVNYLAESINLWSPRPSGNWRAKMLRMNPAFIRMQSDRNFLEAIYEQGDARLSAAEASGRLDVLLERVMSVEIFVEAMDLFRRCPTPSLGLRILRKASRGLPYPVKEMLWLSNWLVDRKNELSEEDRQDVEKLQSRLSADRANGVEGIAV